MIWPREQTPLLRLALTHPSYANEQRLGESNQRLEYLGDAVLGLFVGELLYETFPEVMEGELSLRRAALVREESLASLARQIGIGERLLLGRGEQASGGRDKPSVLSDAFEAVLGAVYLERGAQAARSVVFRLFRPLLDEAGGPQLRDARSRLMEAAQARGVEVRFELRDTEGPAHRPTFTMAARLNGRIAGQGRGPSKQEAAARAAAQALEAPEVSEGSVQSP